MNWNDDQPIYRQLREKITSLILSGVFESDSPLPSVRQVASDYQINHITVSKAYQELVDLGLIEARRGMGMYVLPGAKQRLHSIEKEKFMSAEVPALLTRMRQLGVSKKELIAALQAAQGE